MSVLAKRLVIIFLFLLLGWLGIYTGQVPTEESIAEIEDGLKARAERALAEAGHGWAEVSVKGRQLTLTGFAPSETARVEALRMARASSGDGPILRGVAVVRDATDILITEKPYRLVVRRDEPGALVIEGAVPDDFAKDEILAHAGAIFAAGVTDKLRVAAGAPKDADWGRAAIFGMDQLARLRRGALTIEDTAIRLEGVAASESLAADIAKAISRAPEPFIVESSVAVAVAPGAATSPEDEEITSGDICQERFNLAMESGAVTFRFDAAEIREESYGLLDRVARTAQQCARFRIMVEGHTDSTGDPAVNEVISLARAQSVTAYLVDKGVDPARLTAAGYGARRPVASNDTAAGRAKNRRIEFKIIE